MKVLLFDSDKLSGTDPMNCQGLRGSICAGIGKLACVIAHYDRKRYFYIVVIRDMGNISGRD